MSWLSNWPSDPIASPHYFEPLIEEIRERPSPPGYRNHLRMEVKTLAEQWERACEQPTIINRRIFEFKVPPTPQKKETRWYCRDPRFLASRQQRHGIEMLLWFLKKAKTMTSQQRMGDRSWKSDGGKSAKIDAG
jgi:hypothetical protein